MFLLFERVFGEPLHLLALDGVEGSPGFFSLDQAVPGNPRMVVNGNS